MLLDIICIKHTETKEHVATDMMADVYFRRSWKIYKLTVRKQYETKKFTPKSVDVIFNDFKGICELMSLKFNIKTDILKKVSGRSIAAERVGLKELKRVLLKEDDNKYLLKTQLGYSREDSKALLKNE